MERRRDPETVLSREQLAEYVRRLELLSIPGVEKIYQTAHQDCRFDGKRLPPAAAVQQLVCCWRVLRKFYGGGPH